MACRGFGAHRTTHVPIRHGESSSLEQGGRCCCVKEDVPSCEASVNARRPVAAAQFCRCGALRATSLDHLFIPEDLSIVPSHLKYSKDKFRGVRVDGRMYFLPNSQHFGRMWVGDSRREQPRKETVSTTRDVIERSPEYAAPISSQKEVYKERSRTGGRSSPDCWRSERRSMRQPANPRVFDDRRPRSRQTGSDRGSFVLTVNTGSRYQPPAPPPPTTTSRERRFTIPRTGGTVYSSSNSRGSPHAAVSSSGGSASSGGARESCMESGRAEKRRERRPRVVKFADDDQFLTSIDEEPDVDCDREQSADTGSKARTRRSKDAGATAAGKESVVNQRGGARKVKGAQRRSSEAQDASSGEETTPNAKKNDGSDSTKTVVKMTQIADSEKPARSRDEARPADRGDHRSTPEQSLDSSVEFKAPTAISEGDSLEIVCAPRLTVRQGAEEQKKAAAEATPSTNVSLDQSPPSEPQTCSGTPQKSSIVLSLPSAVQASSSPDTELSRTKVPSVAFTQENSIAAALKLKLSNHSLSDMSSVKATMEIFEKPATLVSPAKPSTSSPKPATVQIPLQASAPSQGPLSDPKPAPSKLHAFPKPIAATAESPTVTSPIVQASPVPPAPAAVVVVSDRRTQSDSQKPLATLTASPIAPASTPLTGSVTALAKAFAERLLPRARPTPVEAPTLKTDTKQ